MPELEELEAMLAPEIEAMATKPRTNGHATIWADISDIDIDNAIRRGKQAAKYTRLMAGDISEYADDESRADAALAAILASRTKDSVQIERMMRVSGLARDKWDTHRTYMQMTIEKAIGLNPETYNSIHTPVIIGIGNGGKPDLGGDDTQDGSLPRFPRTDTGQAELFAHLFRDRVRHDHRRRKWLIYRNHWWEPDHDLQIVRFAIEAARRRYVAAINISSESERKAESAFAISSENRQRIESMLSIARAIAPIADDGEGWDANPWQLGVENGVIELKETGDLRPGRPEDKISRHAPVVFDPQATAPQFHAFVTEILPNREVRRYVQRHAGRALTGTSQQELAFWWGGGANGKSTLADVIMFVMGPEYSIQAAPGLLLKARGERHPTELADLYGSRLVVSVEVDAGRVMAEALVKWLTGGDRVKARYMRGDFFEFAPTFKICLLANSKPTITGEDEAIWRRIKLTPFTVTIPAEKRDSELPIKLRAEASGILNWMIDGCLDWQRGGMQEPPEVSAAIDEYRAESDRLAPFLEECCVVAPKVRAQAQPLYKAYKSWAEDGGLSERERLDNKAFSEAMLRRFKRSTVDGRRYYLGIGLRLGGSNEG